MPTLITLASFNGITGPFGGLTVDAAGDLFGTTTSGGASGDGMVFEIAKTSGGYASAPTTLVSFNYTNGYAPQGGLVTDSAGDLFGTTLGGGAYSEGTVFEIARTGSGYASTPATLVSFNGSNGSGPAGLIADAQGDLLGMTATGGNFGDGTVFEITEASNGPAGPPNTLVSFNGTNGQYPNTGVVADAAGNLFGMTRYGGANGDGTVFEALKIGGIYLNYSGLPTTLDSFNSANGANQLAFVAIDGGGNIFGTTQTGGANGAATVFEIPKASTGYASTATTLASFNGGVSITGLIADAAGNLFGTTQQGGANNAGTVFEIPRIGGTYASAPTTQASFNGTTGSNPTGLIADAAGNLFGAIVTGGTNAQGTVFELTGAGFQVPAPLTISGTVANQATSGTASLAPLHGVIVTDPNIGQTVTATVTLSTVANGTLSKLGMGGYNYTTGVYVVSGTAAAVTTALDGLVFSPTQDQAPAGQTETTAFTINVTDSFGESASDSTTSVVTSETSPTYTAVQNAWAGILRMPPIPAYVSQIATQIDTGQNTLTQFENGLISSDQAIWSTLAVLVTIDAFYNATPSSAMLTAVAAGGSSAVFFGSATVLHDRGLSDPNV